MRTQIKNLNASDVAPQTIVSLTPDEALLLISRLAEALKDLEYKKQIGHQWLNVVVMNGNIKSDKSTGEQGITAFKIDLMK